jgi:hypothetical protein
VFQQIPWFATTDTGTVDLNTSFNHGTREWEDAQTNDQPPQQQQQTQQHTNNANSYKQKRSVVSALSSFRKNQQNLSNIFGRCSPPFTEWKKEDGNANIDFQILSNVFSRTSKVKQEKRLSLTGILLCLEFVHYSIFLKR